MQFIKKTILLVSIFLFTACSYPEFSYKFEFAKTDYEQIVKKLLKKASNQIFPNMTKDEILLVSNFSDTLTLKSDTKLSFILTDLLKNQLVSDYSYTIREVELSKIFRIGDGGFKVLTRDSNKIKNSVSKARYAVVGTYTFTKNQIMLFLKLINIYDGSVLASSSYTTDLTQEIVDSNNISITKEKEKEKEREKRRKEKGPVVYPPMVL